MADSLRYCVVDKRKSADESDAVEKPDAGVDLNERKRDITTPIDTAEVRVRWVLSYPLLCLQYLHIISQFVKAFETMEKLM